MEDGGPRPPRARILRLHAKPSAGWPRRARQPHGLDARPHPGPLPGLSDAQLRELEALLLQGATAHGWPNALWTAQRVAEMIRRHFGVEYHVEHARKLIRRRLGWSSQVPQKKARQRNDEKVAH